VGRGKVKTVEDAGLGAGGVGAGSCYNGGEEGVLARRRWARARPMSRDAGVMRAQAMFGQRTSLSVALEDSS
jgi:hypothetical protein